MPITGINPPPTQEELADEGSSWKRWLFALWAAVARVVKSNGDVVIGSTPGTKLFASTATNSVMGRAVLVAGAVVVANTSVTANTNILVARQVVGGALGSIGITAVVPGTSFTIGSTAAGETSTVAYLLIEPA